MSEKKTYKLIGVDGLPYLSENPGTLGGNKTTKIYGTFECKHAARAIARGGYVNNRVFFADEQTAIAAGYRPCSGCLPEQYKKWKTLQNT